MSARAASLGGRLPIFARTFLLLLAALAVAYGVGMALLLLRRPEVPAIPMSEVVALLSTQMPSSNPQLRVSVQDAAPPPPGPAYRSPSPLRTQLARWLAVPESQVRFYVAPGDWIPARPRASAALQGVAEALVPAAQAQTVEQRAPIVGTAVAAPVPPGVVLQRRAAAPFVSRQRDALYLRGDGAKDARSDTPTQPGPAPLPRLGPYRDNRDAPAETTTAATTAAEPAITDAADAAGAAALPASLRRYLPPYVQLPPTEETRAAVDNTAVVPVVVAPTATALARAPRGADATVRIGEPQQLPPEPRQWVLQSDTLLPGPFLAAARLPDGRWRVVESLPSGPGLMPRLGMLFLLGIVLLLPLAWWFSRALAAPILRFARAADHMGQDAAAPPLPLEGPTEIVRAAASFNAMQSRINRLVRERTQMVGAIAHDLRTPLARLSFRLDQLPAAARAKASADIDEMSAMIQAALDFIREQQHNGARERLDLRLLVESVVDDLADVGHDVTLAPGATAPLQGDPLALRRMVINLIDNALKYGQRARVQLHEAPDGYALVIDDDGPGIELAQREQLFMPFVRGEASRNRETGGIGLGLSSARGIALAHGGDIELDNRAEGGLRVTVVLSRGVPSQRPSPRLPARPTT